MAKALKIMTARHQLNSTSPDLLTSAPAPVKSRAAHGMQAPKPPAAKPPAPSKPPAKRGRPVGSGRRNEPVLPVQAAPGSARERTQQAGLGPLMVEVNSARCLGKLNPAQMEVAKRRANIAQQPFQPSKDGFRKSKEAKKGGEA